MGRDNWYHVPPPDQRVKRHVMAIARSERRWSGSWTVEGGKLYVESAAGSGTVPVGAEQGRATTAEKLLVEIVGTRVRP